jgi:hypothetical protein
VAIHDFVANYHFHFIVSTKALVQRLVFDLGFLPIDVTWQVSIYDLIPNYRLLCIFIITVGVFSEGDDMTSGYP